jgi:nucleotide-binding universal stress UspA family protein
MTAIEERRSRPLAPEHALAGRLTVVGVADEDRDAGAIGWAMGQASGADLVHLVHAYVPISIPQCSWSPVVSARDSRRTKARVHLARALQRVRAAHGRIEIDGSVVAGVPADVLHEFSAIVSLVVVSEDRVGAAVRHRTAELLAHSSLCPVVVVRPNYEAASADADRPVTLLIDTAAVPLATLGFARAEAARRETSLCVAQSWSALHEAGPVTAEFLAERQQQLDEQLAAPGDGPQPRGVFSELLLDDFDDTVIRLRRASQLVVVASTSNRMARLTGPSESSCCPVAIVPET